MTPELPLPSAVDPRLRFIQGAVIGGSLGQLMTAVAVLLFHPQSSSVNLFMASVGPLGTLLGGGAGAGDGKDRTLDYIRGAVIGGAVGFLLGLFPPLLLLPSSGLVSDTNTNWNLAVVSGTLVQVLPPIGLLVGGWVGLNRQRLPA
jgi:hypothetical protein